VIGAAIATLGAALAGSLVASVGEEVELTRSGSFVRVFPDEGDGWLVLYGADGAYWLQTADAALALAPEVRQLTDATYLIDHAIARCPDGGYLHVGSTSSRDGSAAQAARFDAALALTASAWLDSGHPTRRHNDMAVYCGEAFQGALFMDFREDHAIFTHVGADAQAAGEALVPSSMNGHGSSLIREIDRDTLALVSFDFDHRLYFTRLEPGLRPIDLWTAPVAPPGHEVYWSQGAVAVGDRYVIAHVAIAPGESFTADTGNIWLQVFDRSWAHLEGLQITHATGGDANMRPGLAARGDALVLSYDRARSGYVRLIELASEGTP